MRVATMVIVGTASGSTLATMGTMVSVVTAAGCMTMLVRRLTVDWLDPRCHVDLVLLVTCRPTWDLMHQKIRVL